MADAVSFLTALRKLLHADADGRALVRHGYCYRGVHEPLVHTVLMDRPALATPRSGVGVAKVCMASCVVASLLLLLRPNARMGTQIALVCMSGLYAVALRAHQYDKGTLGHCAGLAASCLGGALCVPHVTSHRGRAARARCFVAVFVVLSWYEVGRLRMWRQHVSECCDADTTERGFDVLDDYVPSNIDADLMHYRTLAYSRPHDAATRPR